MKTTPDEYMTVWINGNRSTRKVAEYALIGPDFPDLEPEIFRAVPVLQKGELLTYDRNGRSVITKAKYK
jgi:hypothetical protein